MAPCEPWYHAPVSGADQADGRGLSQTGANLPDESQDSS
jgi:hypothetical protein